ncbi:hypothetical protein GWK16_23465 [Roseomonas sp. JC162]|uniref:Uncharacterized protein n=1 Tax=Neoroseomonas marina TaxID=1232220 RepID=A0A848EJV9_9PROT|nr:hypothetical protein [Neoroseomonas marina]NMJ44226.1 hypothetical protein [Neoroseomonas marina]
MTPPPRRLAAPLWRRSPVAGLLGGFLLLVQPAAAQTGGEDATDGGAGRSGGGSAFCTEINARAFEASLVIRQHSSSLSAGFETDARPQALQMLAWLDQWMGRLRTLVELGDAAQCLDEGEAETYRRALVMASRVGNQVRDEVLRPVPARPGTQQARPQRR